MLNAEGGDFLLDAVFEELEIRLGEAVDVVAFGIGDDYGNEHLADLDLDGAAGREPGFDGTEEAGEAGIGGLELRGDAEFRDGAGGIAGARHGFAEIEVGVGIGGLQAGGGAKLREGGGGVSGLEEYDAEIVVGAGGSGGARDDGTEFSGGIGLIADGVISEAKLEAQAGQIGIEAERLLEQLYGLGRRRRNQGDGARQQVTGILREGGGGEGTEDEGAMQGWSYLGAAASFSNPAS